MQLPTPKRIAAAADSIDPVFLDTPSFRPDDLAREFGVELVFKDERATPIGSFKGRGAEFFAQGHAAGTAFVCASAGNFGQGLAWAARRRGGRLTVFASRRAARCKIEAMAALGARVELCGNDFDEAKDAARAYAASNGEVFVEDGAHPEIAEGAGTIALELTRAHDPFDAVFVPLGNGALVAGMGCWLKHCSPSTRVIAVAAAGAPAMGRAVLGQVYDTSQCDTIADGIAVRVPVPAAVEAVRRVIDDVLFVSEDEIRTALDLIERSTGRRVEAAGAVGLAGLIQQRREWHRQRVAIPICGGNRDEGEALR